jgi:thiol-disulfide isomerase/thioredoxin
VPKYPENLAAGPFDPNRPQPLKTNPNLPPPPPPFGNGGNGSERPLAVAPSLPGQPQGGAHVPSCVILGNRLVNFALPDFYGKAWEWKANRLGRIVLLDFWRTDCPPCLAAIGNLRALQAKYGPKGLEIIGIAAETKGTREEQRVRVATVCQTRNTNYRILLATGAGDPVLAHFAVQALPTLILLDEQGNILWRHEGGLGTDGWAALDAHVQMKLGG